MSTSWDHMLCDIFFVSWSSTQPCSTLFWRSNAKATFQKTTHVWCFANPSTVVYTFFLIQSHLYHHPEWSSGRRIQHHDLILECLVSLRDWDLCTLAMHRSFFEKMLKFWENIQKNINDRMLGVIHMMPCVTLRFNMLPDNPIPMISKSPQQGTQSEEMSSNSHGLQRSHGFWESSISWHFLAVFLCC